MRYTGHSTSLKVPSIESTWSSWLSGLKPCPNQHRCTLQARYDWLRRHTNDLTDTRQSKIASDPGQPRLTRSLCLLFPIFARTALGLICLTPLLEIHDRTVAVDGCNCSLLMSFPPRTTLSSRSITLSDTATLPAPLDPERYTGTTRYDLLVSSSSINIRQ